MFDKELRELDSSKTNIILANTICVLLSLNSKQKKIIKSKIFLVFVFLSN